MKKVMTMLFAVATLFMASCESKEVKVNVDGEWKFSEHVAGKAELNPQNKAMINSIVKLFENGEISLKEGKVSMSSPGAGSRSGTYTITNGKLDMAFGGDNQVSLNVSNEGENLIVLFGESSAEETGKVVLVKK